MEMQPLYFKGAPRQIITYSKLFCYFLNFVQSDSTEKHSNSYGESIFCNDLIQKTLQEETKSQLAYAV